MDMSRPSEFQPAPGFFHHGNAEWQAAEILSQRLLPTHIRDAMSQKPPPRRVKRMVADNQKDDRYWEKRKRNNDAARRSRENRRKLEQDIRTRLVILEEENALLRKEVSILKTKFNVPTDQKFLAIDENDEMVGYGANATLPREAYDYGREDDDLDRLDDEDENDSLREEQSRSMSDGHGSSYGDSENGSSRFSSERSSVSPTQSSSNLSPTAEDTHEDTMPMKKRRIKLEYDEAERIRKSSGGPIPPYSASQPMFPHQQSPHPEPTTPNNSSQYYAYPDHSRADNREQQPINYDRYSHQPLQASVERALNLDRRAEHPEIRSVGLGGFYPPYIRQASVSSVEERSEEGREERRPTEVTSSHSQVMPANRDSCVSNGTSATSEQSAGDNTESAAQQRETEELRSRLKMLSEEVAKMKDLVMKEK